MSTATQINLDALCRIARQAGDAILEVYGTDDFKIEIKEDESPLTEADRRSNAVIVEGLAKLTPEIPILSEECRNADYEERKDWKRFWLVDPLDGTKEFIKRNGEFTVNIALIEDGIPVMGVVYVPVQDVLYSASRELGAFRQEGSEAPAKLPQRQFPESGTLRIVGSRSHSSPETEAFIESLKSKYDTIEFLSSGSSLKFCLVAEGKADIYPRFAPTMEWDSGAAHAIMLGVGGNVWQVTEPREPLAYNKPNLLNPFFICQ